MLYFCLACYGFQGCLWVIICWCCWHKISDDAENVASNSGNNVYFINLNHFCSSPLTFQYIIGRWTILCMGNFTMWHLFLKNCYLIFVVYLIQALVGEGLTHRNVSRKISLVIGARRHLEWGHEKYIIETINSHPALVSISDFSFSLADYFLHKFVFLWNLSLLFKCSYVRFVVMILVHICKWWWQLFCLLTLLWYPALLLIFYTKLNLARARTHTVHIHGTFFARCLVIISGSWHDLFSLWYCNFWHFLYFIISDMFWDHEHITWLVYVLRS